MSPSFPRPRFSLTPLVSCGTAVALFAAGCASSGAPPSKTASGAGTGAMVGGTAAALAGVVAPNSSMNSGAAVVGGVAAGAIIGGAIGAIQQARSNREQDLLAQERAYNAEQSTRRRNEAQQKLALEEELAVRKGFLITDLEMTEAEKRTAEAEAKLKQAREEYQTAYNKTKKLDDLKEKQLAAEVEFAKMEEQIKRLKSNEPLAAPLSSTPQIPDTAATAPAPGPAATAATK
jgi:hypothetical protein